MSRILGIAAFLIFSSNASANCFALFDLSSAFDSVKNTGVEENEPVGLWPQAEDAGIIEKFKSEPRRNTAIDVLYSARFSKHDPVETLPAFKAPVLGPDVLTSRQKMQLRDFVDREKFKINEGLQPGQLWAPFRVNLRYERRPSVSSFHHHIGPSVSTTEEVTVTLALSGGGTIYKIKDKVIEAGHRKVARLSAPIMHKSGSLSAEGDRVIIILVFVRNKISSNQN